MRYDFLLGFSGKEKSGIKPRRKFVWECLSGSGMSPSCCHYPVLSIGMADDLRNPEGQNSIVAAGYA